jgi:hypothetical protein
MAITLLKEIGLLLFGIYAATILIGSILIFQKARKNTQINEKKDIYTLSMAWFFLLIGIGLLIRIYFMFFIAKTPEEFLNQITATERSAEALPTYVDDNRLNLIQILWQIQVGFTTAGIACLMFGTEYQIFKKSKYALTIIEVIVAPLVIIAPYELAHTIYYISFFPPIIWIFLYMIIAKQSTGIIRKTAIMFLIGFVIFFAGAVLNSGTARDMLFGSVDLHVSESMAIFSCWISPVSMMIGIIFMILAILNKFKMRDD